VPVLSTHTHTQSELEEITNKKEIEKFKLWPQRQNMREKGRRPVSSSFCFPRRQFDLPKPLKRVRKATGWGE
jgi:hypothetical protein